MPAHLTNGPKGPLDVSSGRPDEQFPALAWTGERFIPSEGGPEIYYYEKAHRYLLARELLADLVVADLANGDGYGSAWLAKVARLVVGVDIDDDSVRHARARYTSQTKPQVRVRRHPPAGAARRPPPVAAHRTGAGDTSRTFRLPAANADAATCFEAIEHAPNPRRANEEAM